MNRLLMVNLVWIEPDRWRWLPRLQGLLTLKQFDWYTLIIRATVMTERETLRAVPLVIHYAPACSKVPVVTRVYHYFPIAKE